MTTVCKANVFLDWDTARRLDPDREKSVRGIERAIHRLQHAIFNAISRRNRKFIYRVNWRVYHGWHQGKTKTSDRLLFEEYLKEASALRIDNVSFSTNFVFSGELACNSRRSPIFDTCRLNRDDRSISQKMIDTMLVCDLLHMVRSKECSLFIVVANDDDIVPAMFTAEAWQADTLLLHSREHTNRFLHLDGIAERMVFE